MSVTSPRHTDILNGYLKGDTGYNAWVRERLGDITMTAWSFGRVSLTWALDDRFIAPDGVMFGGHTASVADHVAALVAMSALEHADDRFRTSRLETQFFRPVMKPRVTIEGRLVNASRTLIHVEADYFSADGKRAVRITAVQSRRAKGEPRLASASGDA